MGTLKAYAWDDVLKKAGELIEAGDNLIYDVAAERSQIVANVKHMTWFKQAIALELIDTYSKYENVIVPEAIHARDQG